MATAQDLLNIRNSFQDQLNQVNTPFNQSEGARYLAERVNNFLPLQQERRNIQTQAANILPDQINQYTQFKQATPNQGPSSIAMLNSIIANQNRMRGTSDLIGDVINQGQGRLKEIAGEAANLLGQQQTNIGRQYDIANQDYARQLAYEQEQQRIAEARAAEERARAEERAFQERMKNLEMDFQRNESAKNRAASRAAASAGLGKNPAIDALLTKIRNQQAKGVAQADQPITFTERAAPQNGGGPQGDIRGSLADALNSGFSGTLGKVGDLVNFVAPNTDFAKRYNRGVDNARKNIDYRKLFGL